MQNAYNNPELRLEHQIIKFSGKEQFVELMANALPIGKFQLNFRRYDLSAEKGNRVNQSINIYLNIEDALLLSHDILSGRIPALIKASKAKGDKYPAPVWQSLGGIPAAKANREDGSALSRSIKLSAGQRVPFVLTAESGKGEEDSRGLIVPRWGTSPENRVMVAMTDDQLKQLAILINLHASAYTSAQYTLGSWIEPKRK